MARYKIVDRSPRFLPVVPDAQLMRGSFEYALDYLITDGQMRKRDPRLGHQEIGRASCRERV